MCAIEGYVNQNSMQVKALVTAPYAYDIGQVLEKVNIIVENMQRML